MATQTVPQAVPFRKPTDTITQEKLAYILTLKGEIQERKKALEEAEAEVQAGPLRTWEQAWEEARYEGSFSGLVVVDVSASATERKAQALYWQPGTCRFPKRVEKELAQAVA